MIFIDPNKFNQHTVHMFRDRRNTENTADFLQHTLTNPFTNAHFFGVPS